MGSFLENAFLLLGFETLSTTQKLHTTQSTREERDRKSVLFYVKKYRVGRWLCAPQLSGFGFGFGVPKSCCMLVVTLTNLNVKERERAIGGGLSLFFFLLLFPGAMVSSGVWHVNTNMSKQKATLLLLLFPRLGIFLSCGPLFWHASQLSGCLTPKPTIYRWKIIKKKKPKKKRKEKISERRQEKPLITISMRVQCRDLFPSHIQAESITLL